MSVISQCTSEILDKAAQNLIDGHLVAFPTETVYGLGADATNREAVARIYSVKGRPADHPLIVHIASINDLEKWATGIPGYAIELAQAYWPGPMTLVLNRSDLAKDFITGGQDTVGVRVPDQAIALELIKRFQEKGGLGIAAPSANRFGAVSPTSAEAVEDELRDYLSDNDLILDGGSSQVGLESTIIDCTGAVPKVLRPGAITEEMILNLVREMQTHESRNEIRVSGSLDSHYSPKAKVFLDVNPSEGQGFIAFEHFETPSGVVRLACPKTIEDFAFILYDALRTADKMNLKEVVIMQPEGPGLAVAIRDRINRSSYSVAKSGNNCKN